jgi:hypothetical protein
VSPGSGPGLPGPPDKGFRDRKREDHALALIEELRASLDDRLRVRRILLELGRFYDPVLGGAIMEVSHQREIVDALEAGDPDRALGVIRQRYELYIKDRIHLRGEKERPGGAPDPSRPG